MFNRVDLQMRVEPWLDKSVSQISIQLESPMRTETVVLS